MPKRSENRRCANASRATRSSGCEAQSALQSTSAETLVGLGFRGWVTGFKTGNVDAWQQVWTLYSSTLGRDEATTVFGALSDWSKVLTRSSMQGVDVRPLGTCGFCRDECLAISMIAAEQHKTCPALRACAYALVECSQLDEVLERTTAYAEALARVDRIVPPRWIINANMFVEPRGPLMN